MLPKSLLLLATAALATAAPWNKPRKNGRRSRDGAACPARPPPTTSVTASLPVNGGARELAAPPADAVLKYVLLGHGYQNYTCASAGATAQAAGALAVLYNAAPLFPGQSDDSLASLDDFFDLTRLAVFTTTVPLNLNPDTSALQTDSEPGTVVGDSFIAPAPLDLSASGISTPLSFAGHHLFDSANVPTFLVGETDRIRCSKTDSIPAPAAASPGEDGSAAVPWLILDAIEGSVNLKHVYRVDTVGGSAHKCTQAGVDSSEYAALYYFYA